MQLSDDGVKATGTVHTNRTGGAAEHFMSTKRFQKTERRSMEHICDGRVFVSKWNDNSVVHAMSTVHTDEPVQSAKRWAKGEIKHITQPYLIKRYNQGMGGVDVYDRLLGSYRPRVRAKKWWWPLFSNIINISVVAAWKVHCGLYGRLDSMTHLDFRRSIVMCLLKGTQRPSYRIGR